MISSRRALRGGSFKFRIYLHTELSIVLKYPYLTLSVAEWINFELFNWILAFWS